MMLPGTKNGEIFLGLLCLGVFLVVLFDGVQPTDACPHRHADARRIFSSDLEPRILQRFRSRGESVVHERIHAPQFLRWQILLGVEIGHGAVKAHRKGADIEGLDGPDPALAGENVLPRAFHRTADGGNDAKTGDYDASLGQGLPRSDEVWELKRIDRAGMLPWPMNTTLSVRDQRPRATSGLSAALGDVIDRLLNGRDLLGVFVGNLGFELFLQCHHQLDGVERIGTEIVDEGSVIGDFFFLHAQLFGDDGFDLLFNTAHCCTSPL